MDEHDPRQYRRNSDPLSSHITAAEIAPTIETRKKWTERMVLSHTAGLTKRELSTMLGLDTTAMRRMVDCWKAGMVSRGPLRRCRTTNKMAHTWYPPGEAEMYVQPEPEEIEEDWGW